MSKVKNNKIIKFLFVVLFFFIIVIYFNEYIEPQKQSKIVNSKGSIKTSNLNYLDGYNLVWSDEFNSNVLDNNIWSYRSRAADNQELEKWTDQNVEVSDGILKIIAKYDDSNGYTSSEIWTLGKRTIDLSVSGRVEASIAMPEATENSGVWPAFWMLGTAPYSDKDEGQWPISGEIDIMESINSLGVSYATVHGMKKSIYRDSQYDIGNLNSSNALRWLMDTGYYQDYYSKISLGEMSISDLMTSVQASTKIDNNTRFHVYAMEWNKNSTGHTILKFYLDNYVYHTVDLEETYGEFAKFFVSPNYKWYVILDVAVGGNWPNNPTSSEYPLAMQVDYVRYYKGVESGINVESVSLDNSSLSMNVNDKKKLNATVKPDNASNKNIIWDSSDSSIVAVDDSGNVTAISEGTAIISVTTEDGGYKASCEINVLKSFVSVTGVSLDKNNVELKEGENTKLSATITPSDASNKNVSWSSSNPEIATVDNNGKVIAISEGTAAITVTTDDGNYKANCVVVVTRNEEAVDPNPSEIKVTGVTVTPTEKSLKVGENTKLSATVTPSNATNKSVSWTSSDSSVASVDDNGNVTAISNGTVIITVTTEDGNYKAISTINVVDIETSNPDDGDKEDVLPKEINLNVSSGQIKKGESLQLIATVVPDTATNKEIVWTSSDSGIASVDDNGIVNAKEVGDVVITAKIKDTTIEKSATIKVIEDSGEENNSDASGGNNDNNTNIDNKNNAEAVCLPYLSYSTTNNTSSPVVAVINFQNKDCRVTNDSSYIFNDNGNYTFEYVDSDGNKGTLLASVDWINKNASNILENPKTGVIKYIMITVLGIVMLGIGVFYIKKITTDCN